MATVRQTAANRMNSKKSTGPKTQRGKDIACRNSLKHGMAGAGVVLPDEVEDEVKRRSAEWISSMRPFDLAEVWLVESMLREVVRVEHIRKSEIAILSRRSIRGADSWDDDQRLAAERLAMRIADRPQVVVLELRKTTQGCDWLIERWEDLGAILEDKGTWDAEQSSKALDLLGVAPDLRTGRTKLDPPPGFERKQHLAGIVAERLGSLRRRQEQVLDRLDGTDQASRMLAFDAVENPDVRRLWRYEAQCHARFRWSFMRLRSRSKDPFPSTMPEAPRRPIAPPREHLPEPDPDGPPPVEEELTDAELAERGESALAEFLAELDARQEELDEAEARAAIAAGLASPVSLRSAMPEEEDAEETPTSIAGPATDDASPRPARRNRRQRRAALARARRRR